MGVPDHSCLGGAHAGPALEWKIVLVHDGPHHFANVEGFLASGIGLVGENLTYQGETVAAMTVRIEPYVTVDGIGCRSLARKALAGCQVGVFIVAQKYMAGFIDVPGPVLGLAVGTHDAVVAANAFIVLG